MGEALSLALLGAAVAVLLFRRSAGAEPAPSEAPIDDGSSDGSSDTPVAPVVPLPTPAPVRRAPSRSSRTAPPLPAAPSSIESIQQRPIPTDFFSISSSELADRVSIAQAQLYTLNYLTSTSQITASLDGPTANALQAFANASGIPTGRSDSLTREFDALDVAYRHLLGLP